MIGAQQVVDMALAEAARLGKADETIVMVTDRADAALRWANNSMTTNGVSVQRRTTVISIVRRGDRGHVGVADVQRGRSVGHPRAGGGVAGGGAVGAGSPRQRSAAARHAMRQAIGTHRFPAPASRSSAASPMR